MPASRSVSRAPLPWDDPSIDELPLPQREQVAAYWEGRATAELKVARAFVELSTDLAATRADPEVLDLLATSIENEHEHADLCWRLACRYAGHHLAAPEMPSETDFPRLSRAPAELRPTLHAIGLCCINESIATVWLEHCLSFASSPLVRAATRLHVSDEVLHARAGWAHLGSAALSKAAKTEIAKWVLPMLRANVEQWLDLETAGLTAEIPDHGLPPKGEHQGLVLDVVRDVILPGFAHTGIRAPEAARWVNERFAGAVGA